MMGLAALLLGAAMALAQAAAPATEPPPAPTTPATPSGGRAAPAAPPTPEPAGVGTSPAQPAMVPLPKDDATSILGRQVLDGQGRAAGRVTDVLVDAAGAVRAAVVDFGGFLGVGQRRVALAWSALRFDPAARTIGLTLSAPELAAAPEYRPNGVGNVVATPTRDIPRPSALPPPPSAGRNSGAGTVTDASPPAAPTAPDSSVAPGSSGAPGR